jgi:hypothetical protein
MTEETLFQKALAKSPEERAAEKTRLSRNTPTGALTGPC